MGILGPHNLISTILLRLSFGVCRLFRFLSQESLDRFKVKTNPNTDVSGTSMSINWRITNGDRSLGSKSCLARSVRTVRSTPTTKQKHILVQVVR